MSQTLLIVLGVLVAAGHTFHSLRTGVWRLAGLSFRRAQPKERFGYWTGVGLMSAGVAAILASLGVSMAD